MLAFAFVALKVHSETVPLIPAEGTYAVPVNINGKIYLNFTIDSGAADVCIPSDVYSTLRRTDTVSGADLLDSQISELADGSRQLQKRFKILSLRVGGVEIDDVNATVCPAGGSLLLGQSFLKRLPSWSIDNSRHLLSIASTKEPAILTDNITDSAATPIKENAPGIAPALNPKLEQTRYEEIGSKWPMKGITALLDVTHVTYDYGNVRRAWLWLMVGPDAKQKVSDRGHMQSYRYLMAFDCNANKVRADLLVERYDTGDITWPNDKLTGRISKWNRDSAGDYTTVAMAKVCSSR